MITEPYHLTKYHTPQLLLDQIEYIDLFDFEITGTLIRWIVEKNLSWKLKRECLKLEMALSDVHYQNNFDGGY